MRLLNRETAGKDSNNDIVMVVDGFPDDFWGRRHYYGD